MRSWGAIFVALVIICATSSISHGQITNTQISFPSTQLQNEEQVFYCPTDENIIVATWRDFRLGYRRCAIGRSTDGGNTWSDYVNDLLYHAPAEQSDPSMTVNRDGHFFCCYMDWSGNAGSSTLALIRSTDKGAHWYGPVPVVEPAANCFEDKEFITCDRTGGIYDGNLYVMWTRAVGREVGIDSTAIMFATSTNNGMSFEEPLIIGPYRENPDCGVGYTPDLFVQPIVDSDGSIYAFFSGYETVQDQCDSNSCMFMSKSIDGGQTWPIIKQSIFCFDGPNHWWVDGAIDVFCCPAGDADITGGPYDGNIYISFLDWVEDSNLYHADIRMIKSTDGGNTWLDPVRINDDPPGVDVDQFHPWVIVNQDGVVIIVFYDQRMDPNHYMFDVFAAYSFDGGETYTPNQRITGVSSDPTHLGKAGTIAEYIGVAAHHDNITAVWTDLRNGNQDVFSASYQLPLLPPRLYEIADESCITSEPDSLVWGNCWHVDDVSYRLELSSDPAFGSLIINETIAARRYLNSGLGLSDGLYYWRVKGFRTIADDSTEFSEVWSFALDREAPTLATLESPSEGSTARDYRPEFTWSAVSGTVISPEYYEIEISDNDQFTGEGYYRHVEGLTETTYIPPEDLPDEGTYYWRVNHYDQSGNESGYTSTGTFNIVDFICGDANGDLGVNIGDVVYIANHVFRNGECSVNPPIGCPPVPYEAGDVNCDISVNIGDAVYLGNVIFRPGSPLPCAGCP